MRSLTQEEVNVVNLLFDTGCLMFGKFTLRSGIEAPYYMNLRTVCTNPALNEAVAKLVVERFLTNLKDTQNLFLCGVPEGALQLTQTIAYEARLRVLPIFKGQKAYGVKEVLPKGVDQGEMRIIIVDDVISSGASIQDMIEKLSEKFKVESAFVIVDREQDGLEKLTSRYQGINFYSLLKISDILNCLQESGRISEQVKEETLNWISRNKF